MIHAGMDGWSLLAQATETAKPDGMSAWVALLVVLIVFVMPFGLGAMLGRVWKVQDLSLRMGTVLFAAVLGITPFVWQYVIGPREQAAWAAKQAVWETEDAAWPEQHAAWERENAAWLEKHAAWEKEGQAAGAPEPQRPAEPKRRPPPERPEPRTWRSAIRLGIDLKGGTNLVFQAISTPDNPVDSEKMDQTVAAVSKRINPTGVEEVVVRAVGKDRLEVIIPGADQEEVARIKGQIVRLGSLEFAILANEIDHSDIIRRARDAKTDLRGSDNHAIAGWRDVGVDSQGNPHVVGLHDGVVTRQKPDDPKQQQFLVVFESRQNRVTGDYLDRAFPTMDANGNRAVGFEFKGRGPRLFEILTTKNRPNADGFKRRLAILLDDKIHSAPSVNQPISRSGIIEGKFSPKEITDLTNVLKAGALQVPLKPEPISEFSIGPLLAHDVQEKGMRSVIVSSVLVFAFMLGYYLFAGLVADVCLILNIILVLGAMAFLNATFTLPGIAGIVLTIGMAVDANVLIYERMREEQVRGSSLRMTVQNGFDKALSAIIDSNVTTLITALILYMIGTDQIKGFAVTLIIGLVASMFTAIFFGRLIFTLVERKRWLKRIRMMSMIRVPNVDWIAWRVPAFCVSGLIVLVGMVALVARGKDSLDIDFTGGTMVTFEFVEPQEMPAVRAALAKSELGSDVSLERLRILGQSDDSDAGTRFRLRTKEQRISVVRKAIFTSLTEVGFDLRRVTVETGGIVDYSKEGAKPERPTEFPTGCEATLTFSNGVKVSTAQDYFSRALEAIPAPVSAPPEVDDGLESAPHPSSEARPKHPEPSALFAMEGLERPEASPGQGPEGFVKVRLMVSPDVSVDDLQTALQSMQSQMAGEPVFDEINTFESSIASDMQQAAILAILFSLVAIVAYIWFRFERVTWGIAAISPLVFDTLVVIGAIPVGAYLSRTPIGPMLLLEDFKINLPVVAAVLTVIGYSLNDTIVIFDRIREVRGKNPSLTKDMINLSTNQTLSRTILTALTVFIVVVVMYVLGGEGLHGFAFCLLVGVISGTWSTLYIANPVLYALMRGAGPERAHVPAPVTGAKPAAAR